jgi:hypothetical protein
MPKKKKVVEVDPVDYSNLQEVSRHLREITGEEPNAPHRATIRVLLTEWIRAHPDEFGHKGSGQHVYVGDDDADDDGDGEASDADESGKLTMTLGDRSDGDESE